MFSSTIDSSTATPVPQPLPTWDAALKPFAHLDTAPEQETLTGKWQAKCALVAPVEQAIRDVLVSAKPIKDQALKSMLTALKKAIPQMRKHPDAVGGFCRKAGNAVSYSSRGPQRAYINSEIGTIIGRHRGSHW